MTYYSQGQRTYQMDTVNLPTVTTHYLTSQHLAVLLMFEIKVNFKIGVPRFKITSNIFLTKQTRISIVESCKLLWARKSSS